MITNFRILTLALLVVFGQSVFIRKQTIKNDEVLGEVIMIEEIRTTDDGANFDSLIEENAALIEQELDMASQLASMMLNSLEQELVEDNFINSNGTVFNALENLKGVVNEMQKAEHQYLEDVQHQKEEKEKKLIQLEQEVRKDNQFQWNLSDESYYEHEILDEPTEQNVINQPNDGSSLQSNKINATQNFTNKEEEQEDGPSCSDDTITEADIEEMNQYDVKAWIEDDNDNETSQHTQNFNKNPKKEQEKGDIKTSYLNIGLGPQTSMKLTSQQKPLYKDPSIIIGVLSLFAIICGLCYYFIKSKMNLRKSTSTILEERNEIPLSHTSKNRDTVKYEKVKIF